MPHAFFSPERSATARRAGRRDGHETVSPSPCRVCETSRCAGCFRLHRRLALLEEQKAELSSYAAAQREELKYLRERHERSSVHERERLEAEKHGLQEILESFRTGAERQKKKEWQKEKESLLAELAKATSQVKALEEEEERCAIISTFALVGWSCYVRGDHGPIQNALAPLMSPVTVFPFAVLNALREELQFRMVFLGALIAGEASKCIPLMAYQMAVHSGYFALLHFLGGFPTGKSGFALVFTWSLFLDLLRVWSGGMAFVFLLHVQADVAIFVLVWLEDQRRKARAEL